MDEILILVFNSPYLSPYFVVNLLLIRAPLETHHWKLNIIEKVPTKSPK